MKKLLKLVFIIMLLMLPIHNESENALMSFQFLAQGSSYDLYRGMYLSFYNSLFSITTWLVFLLTICSELSKIFEQREYILSRGGMRRLKQVLLMRLLFISSFLVTAMLVVYAIYFSLERRVDLFILFDMGTLFLISFLYGAFFLLLRMNGVKEKIASFVLIGFSMFAQIFSFEIITVAVFSRSTIHWNEYHFQILLAQTILLLVAVMVLIQFKNKDSLLED